MTRFTIRITAPHFVAGVDLGPNNTVVHAAPILRYMLGWTERRVVQYAWAKGWSAMCLDAHARDKNTG